MLTLAHIASQLWRCANCSCATSSDTFGSRKCIIRRVTQSCVHLAKSCNQPPLLLGGWFRLRLVSGSSSNSRGRKCLSWCRAHGVFDGRCDQTRSNNMWCPPEVSFLFLSLRHMLCSSSTIFTSAVTQTGPTEEEESLEQPFLCSTRRTQFAQRVS